MYEKLTDRYYRILEHIQNIKSLEALKPAWRQVQQFQNVYQQERLIDALIKKRDELYK